MVTYSSLVSSISPNLGVPCSTIWTSEYCLPLLVWLSFHCSFHILVKFCFDRILRPDIVVMVISPPVVIACFAYLSAMVFPSHSVSFQVQFQRTCFLKTKCTGLMPSSKLTRKSYLVTFLKLKKHRLMKTRCIQDSLRERNSNTSKYMQV